MQRYAQLARLSRVHGDVVGDDGRGGRIAIVLLVGDAVVAAIEEVQHVDQRLLAPWVSVVPASAEQTSSEPPSSRRSASEDCRKFDGQLNAVGRHLNLIDQLDFRRPPFLGEEGL